MLSLCMWRFCLKIFMKKCTFSTKKSNILRNNLINRKINRSTWINMLNTFSMFCIQNIWFFFLFTLIFFNPHTVIWQLKKQNSNISCWLLLFVAVDLQFTCLISFFQFPIWSLFLKFYFKIKKKLRKNYSKFSV